MSSWWAVLALLDEVPHLARARHHVLDILGE
jgi:hypothetical protein